MNPKLEGQTRSRAEGQLRLCLISDNLPLIDSSSTSPFSQQLQDQITPPVLFVNRTIFAALST